MDNKYYVYELVDPRNGQPFYVGKGKGDRAKSHLTVGKVTNNPRKDLRINDIRDSGHEPKIHIVLENLTSDDAYVKEESLIKTYGREGFDNNGILTNIKKDAKPPSQKGTSKVFTEEHRKKLSESLKGKPKTKQPWNKGLTKSSDPRLEKMAKRRSEVGNQHQIGIKHDGERISKVKAKLTGRQMTVEQKTKMSEAKKGKSWEEIFGEEGARKRRESRK